MDVEPLGAEVVHRDPVAIPGGLLEVPGCSVELDRDRLPIPGAWIGPMVVLAEKQQPLRWRSIKASITVT